MYIEIKIYLDLVFVCNVCWMLALSRYFHPFFSLSVIALSLSLSLVVFFSHLLNACNASLSLSLNSSFILVAVFLNHKMNG